MGEVVKWILDLLKPLLERVGAKLWQTWRESRMRDRIATTAVADLSNELTLEPDAAETLRIEARDSVKQLIADPSRIDDLRDRFVQHGQALLGKELAIEERLWHAFEKLRSELDAAASRPPIRSLPQYERIAKLAAARGDRPPDLSPQECHDQVRELLLGIDALVGQDLPRYLPVNCDLTKLNRAVRVRDDGSEPTGWLDFANAHQRIVVLADPGLGKSWLIRTETRRHARAALQELDSGTRARDIIIPIALRCDELADAESDRLDDALAAVVGARYGLTAQLRTWLAGHIRAGRVVLLLDAWDELPRGPYQRRVERLLDQWVAGQDEAVRACLLTSRLTTGYSHLPVRAAVTAELLPFEAEDVEQTVASWGLSPEAEQNVRNRLNDPRIAELARNPLLLALLLSTAARDQALPTTRGALYEQVVGNFLSVDRGGPGAGRDSEEVGRLLEILMHVAYSFATSPAGWVDRMPMEELASVVRDGPRRRMLGEDEYDVIRHLSRDCGLITPERAQLEGRRPPYRFLHRTIAEYLVARYLAGQDAEVWLPVVEEHLWFDQAWESVIPMLGGLLDDPRPLLSRLLSKEHDPFHHALVTAANVVAELPEESLRKAESVLPDLMERITKLAQTELTQAQGTEALSAIIDRLRPGHTELPLREQAVQGVDPRTRAAAVEALAADTDDPEIRAILIDRLRNDPDGSVRRAAAVALAPAAESAEVSSVFLDSLRQDTDGLVRKQAAEALSGYADRPDLREAFLERLRVDDNSGVRRSVAQALAGQTHHPDIQTALLERLRDDPDWYVRVTVGDMLSDQAAQPEVRAAFLDRLEQDREASVRLRAAHALQDHSERPDVRDAMLNRLKHDSDGMIRSAAAHALGGQVSDADVCAVFVELLDRDIEDGVRSSIAWALSDQANRPEVRRALLARINSDLHDLTRAGATQAITSQAHLPEVRSALLARIQHDTDSYTRSNAIAALSGQADRPEVRDAILARLTDSDRSVRWSAAIALTDQIDHPAVADALLARLLTDSDQGVRSSACAELARQAHRNDVREALLDRLANDRDDDVRSTAARALHGHANHNDVRERLLESLANDSHEHVRSAAARTLAKVASRYEVREALLRCLSQDSHEAVRSAAAGALAGQAHHEDIRSALMASVVDDQHQNVRAAAADALSGDDLERADAAALLKILALRVGELATDRQRLLYPTLRKLTNAAFLELSQQERARVFDLISGLTERFSPPAESR